MSPAVKGRATGGIAPRITGPGGKGCGVGVKFPGSAGRTTGLDDGILLYAAWVKTKNWYPKWPP